MNSFKLPVCSSIGFRCWDSLFPIASRMLTHRASFASASAFCSLLSAFWASLNQGPVMPTLLLTCQLVPIEEAA